MTISPRSLNRLYWACTLVLAAGGLAMAIFYAPTEATMGSVQRIFYLHLPAAINMFIAAFVVFAAGIGYLGSRRKVWDDLGQAAAQVTVLYASVVLLSGMVWAREAWGSWWTWSPRLTFSLVLWLLYVAYLVVRPSIESAGRRAMVSAVFGIVAFIDVPLVYLSVKLLPDIHPSSVVLSPEMQRTLLVCLVPVTMVGAGLIMARFRVARGRPDEGDHSGLATPPLSMGSVR